MNESDFIVTNYDLDLSKALDYSLISLRSTYNRMGQDNYSGAKNIMKGLLAEEAFQMYLDEMNVVPDLNGRTIWHKIDQYDIAIDQVPLDLKSHFIDKNNPYYKKKLEEYPDIQTFIYDCICLVPEDQFKTKKVKTKKYVFAFLQGEFLVKENNPLYTHIFWEFPWWKPATWLQEEATEKLKQDHGKLIINQSDISKNSFLTIYGTSKKKTKLIEKIKLSQPEVTTENSFYQVFAVKIDGGLPSKTITITTELTALEETINPAIGFKQHKDSNLETVIDQNDWVNMEMTYNPITFVGWLNKEDFAVKSSFFKMYSKNTVTYADTKTDNLGCRVADLDLISELLDQK